MQEDVLLLVGAVAEKLGADFANYMDAVKPFIGQGLENTEADEVSRPLCLSALILHRRSLPSRVANSKVQRGLIAASIAPTGVQDQRVSYRRLFEVPRIGR